MDIFPDVSHAVGDVVELNGCAAIHLDPHGVVATVGSRAADPDLVGAGEGVDEQVLVDLQVAGLRDAVVHEAFHELLEWHANFGGLAEIALVKSNQLMPKPAHLTWEEAAVNGLVAATSYRMLVGKNGARMKQGEVLQRAWLGIGLEGKDFGPGALIGNVVEESPAFGIGIEKGDKTRMLDRPGPLLENLLELSREDVFSAPQGDDRQQLAGCAGADRRSPR